MCINDVFTSQKYILKIIIINLIYIAPLKLKDALQCGQEHRRPNSLIRINTRRRIDKQEGGGSLAVGKVEEGSFGKSLDPANLSSGVTQRIPFTFCKHFNRSGEVVQPARSDCISQSFDHFLLNIYCFPIGSTQYLLGLCCVCLISIY